MRTWRPSYGVSSRRHPRPWREAEAGCPEQAAQARSGPGRRAEPSARPPRPAAAPSPARAPRRGGAARCLCAWPGPSGGVRGPRVRAAAAGERGGAGARLSVTAGGGGGRRWWRRRLRRRLLFRHEAAAAGGLAAGAAAAASVARAGPLGRGRGVRASGVRAGRRRGSRALRQPAPPSSEGPAQWPELGPGRGCGALGCGQQALLDRLLRRAARPRVPQARGRGRGPGEPAGAQRRGDGTRRQEPQVGPRALTHRAPLRQDEALLASGRVVFAKAAPGARSAQGLNFPLEPQLEARG